MEEIILKITESELIPLLVLGVCGGFGIGTIFHLISYGIFKALHLVNMIKR